MKMFAFTSKHHEGFSMFDTKTRVRQRANWTARGGPAMESCDLAYSIMETPFRRDVVKANIFIPLSWNKSIHRSASKPVGFQVL